MTERILITGATGNTGRVVAAELLGRVGPELSIVAMARGEASRARLAARGLPTVHGDFDDPASLVRALAGVTRAYLVFTPDERLIARETAFITAARAAGVRHIVKCSAYMADIDGETQNLRSHGEARSKHDTPPAVRECARCTQATRSRSRFRTNRA